MSADVREAPDPCVTCGPARKRLSVSQAMQQVISRDIAGDPDWRLSTSARQWFSSAMRQLAEGEGRSR